MAGLRPRSRTERGVILAFATAAISGLSIYLNSYGVKQVPDAAVYTTAKNGVAAVLLIALALSFGAARESKVLDGRRRLGLLAIAIVGGSIPFVLFFTGLAQATAPSAAFIQKTLFIWVAVMAMPLLGERVGRIQIGALAVLLGGLVLVAPPTGMGWGTGETLIAIATLMWSVEIILAKRLLVGMSAPLLGAARMGLGAVILVGYLAFTGKLAALFQINSQGLLWIVVTGILLAAYVTTWFGALKAAPATMVTSILVVGAVVTGILTTISSGAVPDGRVVVGYLLMVVAVVLVAAGGLRMRRTEAARALGDG